MSDGEYRPSECRLLPMRIPEWEAEGYVLGTAAEDIPADSFVEVRDGSFVVANGRAAGKTIAVAVTSLAKGERAALLKVQG